MNSSFFSLGGAFGWSGEVEGLEEEGGGARGASLGKGF